MTELERLCQEEWEKLPKACTDLPRRLEATIATKDASKKEVNKGSEYLPNKIFLCDLIHFKLNL